VEGAVIDQPHRLAARRRRDLGKQGVEALVVAGEDDHAAELDRDGKGVVRPGGDRIDQPSRVPRRPGTSCQSSSTIDSRTCPPGSPAWLCWPIASTIEKPAAGVTAPAQASAVYQPIELPVTAAMSKRDRSMSRKSA
jgi:hypothetical protein